LGIIAINCVLAFPVGWFFQNINWLVSTNLLARHHKKGTEEKYSSWFGQQVQNSYHFHKMLGLKINIY
jgi:hypothetical protein